MFAILFQKIEQLSGAAQSYTAAGFGLLTQLDPMQIGDCSGFIQKGLSVEESI